MAGFLKIWCLENLVPGKSGAWKIWCLENLVPGTTRQASRRQEVVTSGNRHVFHGFLPDRMKGQGKEIALSRLCPKPARHPLEKRPPDRDGPCPKV
jgi:hypothetical protein